MDQLAERRHLVKSLWDSDHKEVADLHKITGFPKRTLFRWTAQLKKTNDLKQGRRSGRPKKLNPMQRRHLGVIATREKCATSSTITEILNDTYPDLNISARAVRNNLRQLKYRVCVPRTIPLLTEAAMERRVSWAQDHLNRRWGRTIFSDESTFQLFRNTTQVRYKAGKPVPTRAMVKHPYKVHVWGSFCARGIVGFHIFTGIMDGELYREIIMQNLFEQAYQVVGKNWVFQQDNDPKHKAKVTMALLQERCPRILDWPSSSPDLNPIENLWAILKQRVEKRVNSMISKKNPVTKDGFASIIREEWEKIDQNLCLNLIKSMPRRLASVIECRGQKIDY
jgi:transposase